MKSCVARHRDALVQDDDEVEEQEEQRRVERKSKRQDVESAEEEGGQDDSGSDEEEDGGGRKAQGSGSRAVDSDKAKKQDAKNAKQKVPFCSAWPLLYHGVLTPPPPPVAAGQSQGKEEAQNSRQLSCGSSG